MKSLHFFKGKSRIGLTNPPVRQNEINFGVEDGPEAILTENFLSQFNQDSLSEYIFSEPEKINPESYIKTLVKELVEFKDQINNSLKDGEMQIVIGGDNTVTFSSLLALIERVQDVSKVGYIQFDSHGESNSYQGSDSHNFHGMYMRPFFDKFDIPEIDQLIPNKLYPSQGIFIGDMILDGDEPEFFASKKFKTLKYNEYLKDKEAFKSFLQTFLEDFEFIHINFDVDVFDESVAGATGIPEDGKWMKDEVIEILNIIKNHNNVSLDISELNPRKEGAARTIKIAQEIIYNILT